MSTSLITVPLTLKYLGVEQFGLWMTISAVLGMASFADFGLGSGLLNVVSEGFGKDDFVAIQQAVSSGFAVMMAIAAILLTMFIVAWPLVDWAHFFGVRSADASIVASPAIAVCAVCFTLNIGLDVVQRVQLGLQQGYRYGLWQAIGSIMALAGVLIGIHFHVGLAMLLGAIAGGPVLATALNGFHFFFLVRPDLRPRRARISSRIVRRIAKLGFLFFVLQVVSAISFSTDNFILARTLGAATVAGYSIPQRLFSLITIMSSMLIAPLWPAYAEALVRGDIAWVSRTLRKSLLYGTGSVAAMSTVTLLLLPWLLRRWVDNRIHPSATLLLGLAVWTVIGFAGQAVGIFLSAASNVRLQVSTATAFGVVCVLTKVYCVRHYGVSGLPWATVIAYLPLGIVPFSVCVPRLLRDMQQRAAPVQKGGL